MAFAWETVRQGFTDLHIMDRHGSCCTWLLNAVGAINIFETDWMGWGEMAGKLDINLDRRYKAKQHHFGRLLPWRNSDEVFGGSDWPPFIPYRVLWVLISTILNMTHWAAPDCVTEQIQRLQKKNSSRWKTHFRRRRSGASACCTARSCDNPC